MPFTIVEGATVTLKRNGYYRQVDVYARSNQVFAKSPSGYIMLLKHHNATSAPKITWEDILWPAHTSHVFDPLGRMLLVTSA
jgi:hypothetical protein